MYKNLNCVFLQKVYNLTLTIMKDILLFQEVLYRSLSFKEVVVIAHTLVGCYTGTDHFQKPLISLVRALRKKISNFVVWGNPYAVLDIPEDLTQFVFVYDRGPWVKAFIKLLNGEIQAKGKLPVELEWKAR